MVLYESMKYAHSNGIILCVEKSVFIINLYIIRLFVLFFLDCRDLLQGMLVANPSDRLTMEQIFTHPWLNEDLKLPFIPHPYPNGIKADEVQDSIIEHMTEVLEIGVAIGIKQDLLTNKATSQYAIYCLLSARLARYEKQYSSNSKLVRSKDRRRSNKKKVSKDHGFFDDDDSSDVSSTATAPPLGRKTSKVHVLLRRLGRGVVNVNKQYMGEHRERKESVGR